MTTLSWTHVSFSFLWAICITVSFSALRVMCKEISLTCHVCHDTGYYFLRSFPRDLLLSIQDVECLAQEQPLFIFKVCAELAGFEPITSHIHVRSEHSTNTVTVAYWSYFVTNSVLVWIFLGTAYLFGCSEILKRA